MSRFLPPPREAAAPAPPILVTGLTVGGEPHPVSAVGESDVALSDLSPGRHQLQVDFVALGFATGELLKYQYRLEGSHADWSPPSPSRSVNYANLAPGRYRFLVRALNADGVVSPRPAVVAFTVLPPIWQRWWFVSLATLALALVGYASYRIRVGHLVDLERERMRIASDLHDDIGANLTKISILSEVARQRHPVPEAADESVLTTIARISRESVAAMNDIVWAISPRRDTLADLVSRMRLHAEETCVPREIELAFLAPDQEGAAKLAIDTRRDLYLIFKEAVNNAARHSGCARLEVALVQDRSALVLSVRDNGRGFDPDAVCDGNGVASKRRRAEVRGARLDIASAATGTTIRLRIDLSGGRPIHPSR